MTTLREAATRSGIPAKAIEKDWWVTLALKALFEGQFGQYMVFKGGTSLSKGWGLIERFSEDIDIALSPAAFEMQYHTKPSKKQVDQLRRTGNRFISNEIKDAPEQMLDLLHVPTGTVSIQLDDMQDDRPDKDPQVLYIVYRSLLEPSNYLRDEVKIEISVRSLLEPFAVRPIFSLLSQYFPSMAYPETPFQVATVEPRKTFIEKMFLLTEEYAKEEKQQVLRVERMSRHLADLHSMWSKG